MQHGLALASGGARGAYQAGALLLLAERGVQFDAIAGTSIGALNGAYYAQGDGSKEHLEKLCERWGELPGAGIVQISGTAIARAAALVAARAIPWPVRLTLDKLVNGSVSILDPEPMADILDEWIDYDEVCSSRREFVVALLRDFYGGILTAPWREASYFRAAELGPTELRGALLAAAAIPLAFPSQKVRGRPYSDAGLAEPLPALESLKRFGVARIVSIFLSDRTPQNRADFVGATVLQIRPSEEIHTAWSTFDFSRESIERLLDLGYRDAKETFDEAQELWECVVTLKAQGDENIRLADALPDRARRQPRLQPNRVKT